MGNLLAFAFCRPLWTDDLLSKRRPAAYGGAVGPGGSPTSCALRRSLVDDIRQWNIEARTEDAERELLRSLRGTVRKIVRRASAEPVAEDDEDV